MISHGDPYIRTRIKWGLALLPALGVAALAGIYSVGHPKQALALGALAALALVLLDLNGRTESLLKRFRWLPFAWVALLLVTDLRFDYADPRAVAAGAVSLQHVVELLTYATVGALALRARGTIVSLYPRPVPKGLLLAWPLVAVVSALWTVVHPLYTFVRAGQLLVIATLALLLVRIWLSDRATGEELFARTLRLFVQVVTILALIGLAVGAEEGAGRFTWPGVHTGMAGTYLGAAFVILVLGGRSWTRFPAHTYWPRVFLFGATVILSETRNVLAGIVLAVAIALWLKGREKPITRYLGILYYVVGALVLISLAATQLGTYLSRGETVGSLESLSGRIPLWEFAIGRLESIQEWAVGFGYGASRAILLDDFHWAGSAHSTWVELLLGVGLVGAVLAATSMILVGFWLVKRRSFGRANLVATSLLAYFVMTSFLSEVLVLPGLGFTFLALVHIPALAQRGMRRDMARGTAQREEAHAR